MLNGSLAFGIGLGTSKNPQVYFKELQHLVGKKNSSFALVNKC